MTIPPLIRTHSLSLPVHKKITCIYPVSSVSSVSSALIMLILLIFGSAKMDEIFKKIAAELGWEWVPT